MGRFRWSILPFSSLSSPVVEEAGEGESWREREGKVMREWRDRRKLTTSSWISFFFSSSFSLSSFRLRTWRRCWWEAFTLSFIVLILSIHSFSLSILFTFSVLHHFLHQLRPLSLWIQPKGNSFLNRWQKGRNLYLIENGVATSIWLRTESLAIIFIVSFSASVWGIVEKLRGDISG